MQKLRISENERFLVLEDGTPFFWLGDTAWELFHKLNREEAEHYLRNRAELGFNVIQAVALAEFEGITTDNAYGRKPLKQNAEGRYDPSLPDTDGEGHYWSHVDYIVDRAAHYGLYMAFLPTWGDKFNCSFGKGPEVFDKDNARTYGRWLGGRYADRSNIVWVMGGDRQLATADHHDVVNAIAEGIREGGSPHLRTLHPPGDASSSSAVHLRSWLDFNMIQSGHHDRIRSNYMEVQKDYGLTPVKPTIDAEPCYEDHPVNFAPENGYFDEADVRQGAYYAVFAGAFGHTYGHHSIWSMTTQPGAYFVMHWRDALERPGAAQMRHLRFLMETRPFLERVPDQDLIADNFPGMNYMVATRGRSYAMIYSPNGIPFKASFGRIEGSRVRAAWFDPRTGETTGAGEYENKGMAEFQPPSSGRGNDWVLVLDAYE